MRNCERCGASFFRTGNERLCLDCRENPEVNAPSPEAGIWRRAVTGSIAAVSLVVGWVPYLEAEQGEAECKATEGWFCGGELFLYVLILPLTVIAVFFGLAALIPFGTFRRVIIGIGSALLSFPAALALLYWLSGGNEVEQGVARLVILGIACLSFAGAYRLAR